MPIPSRHFLPCAAVFASMLIGPGLLSAQEQINPPSQRPYTNAPPAPIGHRQPRAADVPVSNKTDAEQLEERQQADLNRRLRICRGC